MFFLREGEGRGCEWVVIPFYDVEDSLGTLVKGCLFTSFHPTSTVISYIKR